MNQCLVNLEALIKFFFNKELWYVNFTKITATVTEPIPQDRLW